jgi:hypothetical protein
MLGEHCPSTSASLRGVVVTNSSEWHSGSDDPETKETGKGKSVWSAPQLREFGHLSFVVKGISYLPMDGLQNLTP